MAEKKSRAAKTTSKTTTKSVRARKPKQTTASSITPEHIAERAYYIWAEGSDGDAFAHWVQAERELTTA